MAMSVSSPAISIVSRFNSGLEQKWFIDVLGRGLSKITPVSFKPKWNTADDILVGARILPSYLRSGGYDRVDARVEVEYPLVGLGTFISKTRGDDIKVEGETLDKIGTVLSRATIPTAKIVIPLNDDGVDGDREPGNHYWTGRLSRIPIVDGHYALRYIFDLTAGGCTSRREANQSLIVHASVDPNKTKIDVIPQAPTPPSDKWRRSDLRMTPVDANGNLLGPGFTGGVSCQPDKLCRVDLKSLRDHGDGSYSVAIETAQGTGAARLKAFNSTFSVSMACETCSSLMAFTLGKSNYREHDFVTGKITLNGLSPKNEAGGTVVYLESSDRRLIELPESVLIPSGSVEAEFKAKILHLLNDKPMRVRIAAVHGDQRIEAPAIVIPEQRPVPGAFKPEKLPGHYPSDHSHAPK